MTGGTITLTVEEYQDRIFIKPSTSEENTGSATFTTSHICDKTDCDCILQLKLVPQINRNKIVHLDLSNCKLKSVPDSLSDLPLKSLNLSNNSLKTVPNSILIGLASLENLDLSCNRINEFDLEPKCILNLRKLDLHRNGMKYLPIWIMHVRCRNLSQLDYSFNILGNTEENLYSKVYSYNLRKLVLRDASILNANISYIKAIRTLQILNVSRDGSKVYMNSFTNYEDLLDNPTWKDNLEVLHLSSLNIGFLPNSITCLTSLKELYLSKNKLVWLPEVIGNLETLEILDVSHNTICILPNTIALLKSLRILKLQHNKLANVQILSDLINLQLLDLYDNELDYPDLDLHRYKYIDLEMNWFQTSPLGNVYNEKRTDYRQEFNLSRIVGYNNEYQEDSSDSEFSNKNLSDTDSDNPNITPNLNYEEESWDDEKIKSHPDVTTSDDEWQGYNPIEKLKKTWKQNLSLEHLLDDLYADAD